MDFRDLAAEQSANLGRFLNWWSRELADCLPPSVRRLAVPPTTKLVIEIHKLGTLRLTKVAGSAREELMTVQPNAAGQDRSLEGLTEGVDEVVISLPESCGVRRKVELPAAARENLREVLTIEMDRLTPFKADEIYFAHGEPSPGRTPDQIGVELTIVPKGLADDVMRMARSLGIEPDVLALGDDGKFAQNLLGTQTAAAPRGFSFVRAHGFAALLVLLALAAVAIPFIKQQQVITSLQAKIDSAAHRGGDVEALAQRLAAWESGARQVSSFRTRFPPVVAVLNELSNTIPKATWLTQIDVSKTPSQVVLSGYSSNAPALIAPLEALDTLQGVKFDEPVSFDEQQSRDRFRISASLVAAAPSNGPRQ